MSKLSFQQKKENNKINISVFGQIDEDADFSTINLQNYQEIELDLNKVKAINSCGIREWINWINQGNAAQFIYYKNCPKVIVDQINMVEGFLPTNGKVKSFYVPYYSEETEEEKNVLFTYGKEFDDKNINPPSDVVDKRGNAMEMDILEAKYFKFISRQ